MNSKKILIPAFILFAACTSAIAQSEKKEKNEHGKLTVVPNVVKSAFARDFHGEKGTWEKEKSMYEVNFKPKGKSMSALYDANGNKTETETDIKISELPVSAITYISEHFKHQKIRGASMITKANGEINYEAELTAKDVLFSGDGKFIKTTKD
jgi:Protein of unknown function (DUF2874).